MAYNFESASSQYLSVSSFAVSHPWTVSALFRKSGAEDESLVFRIGTASNREGLGVTYDVARSVAAITATSRAVTSTTFTDNVWTNGIAIFPATNSRKALIDGFSIGTNTTNVTGATYTSLYIAARVFSGSLIGYLNGQISEVAIWSAELTTAECISLGKRFKPNRIRPQSLVFYAPLIRELVETKGGKAITNNNTATVFDHPRVY